MDNSHAAFFLYVANYHLLKDFKCDILWIVANAEVTFMTFYSHYHQDASLQIKKQTVEAHCRAAATFAQNALSSIALGYAGYIAGLLHDMGKMKQEFQDYLLEGKGARGSVNHSFAGCRLLLSQFHADSAAGYEDLTAELLAFAVGAHHGLFDCIE